MAPSPGRLVAFAQHSVVELHLRWACFTLFRNCITCCRVDRLRSLSFTQLEYAFVGHVDMMHFLPVVHPSEVEHLAVSALRLLGRGMHMFLHGLRTLMSLV